MQNFEKFGRKIVQLFTSRLLEQGWELLVQHKTQECSFYRFERSLAIKKGAKFPVDRFEQRPDLRVSNDFSYFNYFPTPSEIIVKKAALPFIMKN